MPKENLREDNHTYWYRFDCYACPVCGAGEEQWERSRVYGEKPEHPKDRYFYHQNYDYCLESTSIGMVLAMIRD